MSETIQLRQGFVCALSIAGLLTVSACGAPPPRTAEMMGYQDMRSQDYAETVAERHADLAKKAKKYYAKAIEAHEDDEPEERAHFTRLTLATWRTAEALSRTTDAEDSHVAAKNRLKHADEAYAEMERRLGVATQVVERMERIKALQTQMTAAEGTIKSQKLSEKARDKVGRALLELKQVENMDAARHASGELNKAQASLKVAASTLEAGKYKDAEKLADLALADIKAAMLVTKPKFDAEQTTRAIDAEVKALFKEAGTLPRAQPRVSPAGVVVTLRGLFEAGKTEIGEEKLSTIDKIADLAKRYGKFKVLVEGHTDNRGGKTNNLVLSQGRAQTVLGALVERGVDPTRMSSIGAGGDQPIADNRSRKGRSANRRVDVVFMRPTVNN